MFVITSVVWAFILASSAGMGAGGELGVSTTNKKIDNKLGLLTCHQNIEDGFKSINLEEEKKSGLMYDYDCFHGDENICYNSAVIADKLRNACLQCCLPEKKTTSSTTSTLLTTTQATRLSSIIPTSTTKANYKKDQSKKGQKSNTATSYGAVIVGALSGGFLLAVVLIGLVLRIRKKWKRDDSSTREGQDMGLLPYSVQESESRSSRETTV